MGAEVGAAVGAGVALVPDDCPGESRRRAAKPFDELESVDDSDRVDVAAFVSASPFHVDVGPVPKPQPEALLHVTLLLVSGRFSARPSSFDCAGARLGVVYAVLLTYVFDDLSTDAAVVSAAIQTCSRCADSGLKA